MTSHAAVLDRFAREGYRIGPHKAFQISRDASRVTARLYSAMAPGVAARLLLDPIPDFPAAVAGAVAALPPGSRIGVMPRANATIPILRAARGGGGEAIAPRESRDSRCGLPENHKSCAAKKSFVRPGFVIMMLRLSFSWGPPHSLRSTA